MQEIPGAAAQTGVSGCIDITASMSKNTEADGKHPESTEEKSREGYRRDIIIVADLTRLSGFYTVLEGFL